MGEHGLRRVTPEHTTGEAIEIMRDREDDAVLVVDRDSKELIGVISRDTLIRRCVRAWHEPTRCRIGSHLRDELR